MFQKVLEYAGEYRKTTYLSMVVMLIGIVMNVLPFLFIYQLIRPLLLGESLELGYAAWRVAAIAVCGVLYAVLYVKGLSLSHRAAYNTLKNLRASLQGKLERQPLGVIQEKGVGALKKMFIDDIDSIELLLAHALPEGLANLAVPAFVFLAMFFVDWKLALLSLCALPLGLVVCFGSMCRFTPLRWLTRTFIWIIRGTPLMLQIIVVYYVPGLAFGIPVENRLGAVLAAFIINYAAYFSEIYRGGIEGIPQGQWEAGQVLGMTRGQIFRKVVLLQVVKRILAPMSNEVITLVKDTSLARVIGIGEVIRAAQDITTQRALLWPLFYTGVFYLLFNGGLTLLFGWAEKKLNYYKG